MKVLLKKLLFLLAILLLFSCIKNADKDNGEEKTSTIEKDSNIHELCTDYYWNISDGRYIENKDIYPVDWFIEDYPQVIFYKLELPSDAVIYQERLRNEMFTLVYQTYEKEKLHIVKNEFYNNILNMKFEDDFNYFSLKGNNYSSGKTRVGIQENFDFPLVGIWGSYPSLLEYRLVDASDCLYYMEILNNIPNWAVREGTYLLRQVDENVLETVSSFPDGRLRLEIQNENRIFLRPLFTAPEEEGFVDLLELDKNPFKKIGKEN